MKLSKRRQLRAAKAASLPGVPGDPVHSAMLAQRLLALQSAQARGCSKGWCLALWRRFVLLRDAFRCAACDSTRSLRAHHIFRRCFLPAAQLQTGNGITLCVRCHKKAHPAWNGRPGLIEPLNARGGDNQEEVAFLFGYLANQQAERGEPESFYFLSNDVLILSKMYQGLPPAIVLSGSRVSRAYRIWEMAPVGWYHRMANEVLPELLSVSCRQT